MYKDSKIEFRLTADLKQKIKKYAEKNNITMSEAIRQLCEKVFKGEEK